MAPPKVSLNEKPSPPEVCLSAETLPSEKKQTVVPCFVGVETPATAPRRSCKQRKKRIIIIVLAVIGIVVAAIIVTAAVMIAKRHHEMENGSWEGHVKQGDQTGTEQIRTDGPRRFIFISRDQQGNLVRMDAMLDYNRHMAGFLDDKRCYVDQLPEDFEQGCRRWDAYKNYFRTPRRMRVVTPPIDPGDMSYFAGEDIAKFCEGTPAYRVVELPPPEGSDPANDGRPPPPGNLPPPRNLPPPTGNPPPTDTPDYDVVYL